MVVQIINADCLEALKELEDNSIDAVVTDPPYGLSNTKPVQVADVLKAWVTGNTEAVPAKRGGFMGKDWDSFVPPPAVWEECLRVLKPGGHMAVFAGARTQDLMGLSIRLAGFEIRDTLGWIYGSGFPKSMSVSKAIESTISTGKSNSRSLRATEQAGDGERYTLTGRNNGIMGEERTYDRKKFTPANPEAAQWSGWGTALKPAIEPIILARKPLEGTVANNVLAHGVGGLNIDACRVEAGDLEELQKNWDRTQSANQGIASEGLGQIDLSDRKPDGRFPANVLLDEHAAAEMDEQSDDSSRFFPVFKYQAKAPKKERPIIVQEDGTKIQHPTVKPVALMEWLVTLITPTGGTVFDPFAGTGTTLQAAEHKGFNSIGIEQDSDYVELINHRLSDDSEKSTG